MSLEHAHDIVWVDIKDIKLNPKNTNKHPNDQIERLAKIIAYQGWRWPVIVWKERGIVAAGEGRYLAAKKLKLKKIPVSYQSFDDEDQFAAFVTSDNAIASWAALDLKLINETIGDFDPSFDIDLLGIKDFEIEPADKYQDKDADIVPDVKDNELGVKLGDIYQLGEHRLMCGDSTDKDTVEKLMNGKKADITFTSPPYNAAKNDKLTGQLSGFDKKYNQHSDDLSDDDYNKLLVQFTELAMITSKYVFVNIQLLTHNRSPLFEYQSKFKDKIKDILIWNKKQAPPNIVKGAFNTRWEYVFCFSEDHKTRGFPCEWRGQYPNVIETESNSGNEFAKEHKAGFPVSFPLWILEKLSFAKSVYDPFGGTGTTLIACEKTNRKCFMMELDPHYCSVIIKRWQDFTGKTAIKLNKQVTTKKAKANGKKTKSRRKAKKRN